MNSNPTTNPLSGTTLNRRSLLKGSATIAASTVAFSTLGLLNERAQAEQPKSVPLPTMDLLEDLPGGV